MKLTLQNLFVSAIGAVAVFIAFTLFANPFTAGATDATVVPARMATTSPAAVTSTASLVFATSTCSSRVITTAASDINITFTDVQGLTPTALLGHVQRASTTVAYDAGLYGCGAVKIYSYASQTLTVSEAR